MRYQFPSLFALGMACMLLTSGCRQAESAWQPAVLSPGNDTLDVYIPDFSYAGYRWGEVPYPQFETVIDVTEYGAVPNDGLDDTAAIHAALTAANEVEGPVTVRFPAGRFVISDYIFIERGDLIIEGAGSGEDGTILFLERPLEELESQPVIIELDAYLKANDKKQDGEWFSPYSWTGGIIWTRHPDGRDFSTVTAITDGRRGEHTFTVEDAAGISEGQVIRVNWFNREGDDSSLLHHVYELRGIEFGERLWEYPDEPLITQDVTVTAVSGNSITIKEPLLHDLRPEWTPVVSQGEYLENVGIQHLRVEFPDVPFAGHHLEAGYNAFYLNDLLHSWMRDVHIHNADSGILSDFSSFVTLEGITVTGRRNHYAIHLGKVQHFLVKDFRSETHSYHPISFNTGSRASVFTNGYVLRPMLDQHRGLNHQNLFDNIDAVEDRGESQFFRHGGAGYWGPSHGAFNTFWNVRATFTNPDSLELPVHLGSVRSGGSARLIALRSNVPFTYTYEPEPYVEEAREDEEIAVPSLYEYQLNRRLGRR